VAAVATLLDEATVWVGARGYEQWPLPFPQEEVAAAIDRGEVYVAELDGDVVATATLLWDDPMYWGERPPDAAYVHKLAVSRACSGQRIGQAIVEWADRTAAAAGRDFLRLDCLRDNPGIRAYYERLGFEHRADLVVNGRDMSIYERRVHTPRR
jgi:GNAT superfamily N-acetyltransferase